MTPCRTTKSRFKKALFSSALLILCVLDASILVSGTPNPNYVAPQVGDSENQGRVITWSEYRQRLKEQGRISKASPAPHVPRNVVQSDKTFDTGPTSAKKLGSYSSLPSDRIIQNAPSDNLNDHSKPITIYLPPFKAPKQQKQSKLLTRGRTHNFRSNDNSPLIGETQRLVHEGYKLHKPTAQSVPQRPVLATNYTTTSTYQQIRPPMRHVQSSPEPTRPTNTLQPVTEGVYYQKAPVISGVGNGVPTGAQRGIAHGPIVSGVPQYSRLAAPSGPSSFGVPDASQNLVESIFAQSQVRHAPPSFEGLTPITSVPGNPNPLQSILADGNTINHLSNLAKNLLSLPNGNQQLFSTVTNALAGISKPAKLTSTAVLPGAASETSVSTDVAAPALGGAAPQSLISNVKLPDGIDLSAIGNTEQRAMLEEVFKAGELDRSLLNEMLKDNQHKLRNNSNKLMEWIQQNRPSVSDKDSAEVSVISAEQLPYYGSYCGGFSAQQNNSKFNINGALWAVDDRRFIVSKFHFRPGSMTENITFWAGPKVITDDMIADIFPSDNGFYIRPEPIDFTVFTVKPVVTINATIRTSQPVITTTAPSLTSQNNSTEEDDFSQNGLRQKRDLFREIYENGRSPNAVDSSNTVHLTVKGGVVTPAENVNVAAESVQIPVDISNFTVTPEYAASEGTTTAFTTDSTQTILTSTALPTPSTGRPSIYPTPLEWYEGFQPLLLTLPDDKWIKTTYWMSLRNHKKKSTVAAVLIPNGPAFKIPAPVQLKPITSNVFHQLSSGAIKLIDTKTIEVTDFSFTSNGVPAWFMVGKDIGPNSSGHIVPIFDRTALKFDCESLKDYRNETVTLRLPGTLGMKDVFWFAVFSPPRLLELSKLYVPYKDINLPPDLRGIATPRCVLP